MSAAGKWDSGPHEKEAEEQLWVGSGAVLYTIKQNCPHLSKSQIYVYTQLVTSWQKIERNQNFIKFLLMFPKLRIKSAKLNGEKYCCAFAGSKWLKKPTAARLPDCVSFSPFFAFVFSAIWPPQTLTSNPIT